MNFIIGLGNPGSAYARNRHNTGFMVVDYLAQKLNLKFSHHKKLSSEVAKDQNLILAKPQTFMNGSGEAVCAILNFYNQPDLANLENLYIIHDDLDLELGSYKIQLGTGPKIHNGLASIYQQLKSKNFYHVRIGVDSRNGDRLIPGANYVLQNFSEAEKNVLNQVLGKIAIELSTSLLDQ